MADGDVFLISLILPIMLLVINWVGMLWMRDENQKFMLTLQEDNKQFIENIEFNDLMQRIMQQLLDRWPYPYDTTGKLSDKAFVSSKMHEVHDFLYGRNYCPEEEEYEKRYNRAEERFKSLTRSIFGDERTEFVFSGGISMTRTNEV